MAVHVPLSPEAQLEARVLMMSTNNILSPANGKPIIVPSQDIVLGIYHLSYSRTGEPGEGMVFADVDEVRKALDAKAVTPHSKILCRANIMTSEGEMVTKRVETTPGRMLLSEILPRNANVPFDAINQLLTKRELSNVFDMVYRHCGQKETVIFADQVMKLGFSYAGKAGISFGKDDMIIPGKKVDLVSETHSLVKQYEQQYAAGLITQGEKYNKVIDAWSQCTDRVASAMMAGMSESARDDIPENTGKTLNSIYMMAHSGARGSEAQMKQLAGMRGLMAKPSGEIIETPIISNFKEGLSVLEYFNSTHGARKGLADTALKTANSGYLTRRLVDVAQDCIIVEEDCGTQAGLTVRAVIEGGEVISPLSERTLGRVTSVALLDPDSGAEVIPANHLLDERDVDRVDEAGIEEVMIRSVLTCETKEGVCGRCYGRDLARGTVVNIGEAVGVIAAQSIGEPGTQLTMRTFHIGGTAQRGTEQSSVEAALDSTVRIENQNLVTDSSSIEIIMGRNCEIILKDKRGAERARHRLPYGAKLFVKEGEKVKKDQALATWDPFTLPLISEITGKIQFLDMIEGLSFRETMDEQTGVSNMVVVDWRQQPKGGDLKPRLALVDGGGNLLELSNGREAQYFLSVDAILNVENGDTVHAGDVLARIPKESTKTRDITGGLPRVAELFEARKPKDHAIISDIDGRVEFGKDYKSKRRIIVIPEDDEDPVEHFIPKGKHISVHEGDFVRRGDPLMDGNAAPHDILRVLGVEALAVYLIEGIQEVYRLQGVKINDKHIEVICRQMMQKVEITDPGETTFLIGEQVDRTEYDEINARADRDGHAAAKSIPILQGITKASLQTRSFVSAASFQETTRVLTEAAVAGKSDDLVGLKENVIVGRLIPAGTGSVVNRINREAAQRALEQQLALQEDLPAEAEALAPPEETVPAPAE